MNENINIAPEESKLVIYLVVAAKVIVYILLMLGFAGVLGAVCIKAVSFFKIDGILKEVVMQSTFSGGNFLAAWVLLKNWDHLPITDLGLSLKGRAKDIFWGTFVALAIYAVGFGILYGIEVEVEIAAVHFSAYELPSVLDINVAGCPCRRDCLSRFCPGAFAGRRCQSLCGIVSFYLHCFP